MSVDSLQNRMFGERRDKKVFEQAKSHAFAYIDGIDQKRVVPSADIIKALSIFDEPIPERSSTALEVVEKLHTYGSPATVAQTGGRYFGFVNGSVIPAALAARWLADTWDQNAALYVISPIASKLEHLCERWLVDLLGLPQETVAGLVGGTSVATHCGLAAARYELLRRQDWDVNELGLNGSPGLRIVLSDQAHGTVFKALSLLGIGRKQIEIARSDSQGRIEPENLPSLDERTLLILQAGNVNTGAFDDFHTICTDAKKAGAWIHIDGAFGLWAAASGGKGHLTDGIELADSWSVDGHKTLNTPYDCGVVLCRHPQAIVSAMQASGSYIQFSDERDGMLFTPDMSRRARSVELWAALKYLGRVGVAELIDGMCERAQEFARLLAINDFHVLNEVVFNQVLFCCENPELTSAVLQGIQGSGILWCGGTMWTDDPAIRISLCSWATTKEDVCESVEEIRRIRDDLRRAT